MADSLNSNYEVAIGSGCRRHGLSGNQGDTGDDRRGSGTGLAGGINAHRKALAYVTSLRQPDHKVGHVECRGGASLRDGLRAADGVEEAERRSEEHTSELQSLMRISYAVF